MGHKIVCTSSKQALLLRYKRPFNAAELYAKHPGQNLLAALSPEMTPICFRQLATSSEQKNVLFLSVDFKSSLQVFWISLSRSNL